MDKYFQQNRIHRLALSAGAFIITLSILWSIISRAANIFFLSNRVRLILTGLILIISFLVFIFSVLNRKVCDYVLRNIKDAGKYFLILVIISIMIAAILFLSGLLPTVSIPVIHDLKIQPLPAVGKVVYIESINEMIDSPETGSNLVGAASVQVTGGNYTINGSEITLEEGALLTYSSFYSGCSRIYFKTTPKSGKVLVQFDDEEETYSLFSTEQGQTEINLCSGLPFNQLSIKWKLIAISNYFLNITALASIFGFEIFLLFFKKRNTNLVRTASHLKE